jgi:hypothetical protein
VNKWIATATLVLMHLLSTALGERTSIEIFSYASFNNSDQTAAVENLLRQKLEHLVEETISAHPELNGLSKLTIVSKNTQLPDPGNLATYWKSTHVLEILSGAITGSPPVVTSNVYLGDLRGSLAKSTLSVQIEINPKEYRSYRDMHSALTLYALAMDAKTRSPQQHGVVSQYLAEAESLLKSIPNPDENARALSDAVAKDLIALKK